MQPEKARNLKKLAASIVTAARAEDKLRHGRALSFAKMIHI